MRTSNPHGRPPHPFRRLRRIAVAVSATLLTFLLAHQYVRAYRVQGPSDAPSYLQGDLIMANRAAYDLRLPFTRTTIARTGSPRRGDVVLYTLPTESHETIRRVVGLPGDTIEVHRSRIILNGRALEYEAVDPDAYADINPRNKLGTRVEIEHGAGPAHPITYTPSNCDSTDMAERVVPDGEYFLMGDNRDLCVDSRRIGTVGRDQIRGRIFRTLRSQR